MGARDRRHRGSLLCIRLAEDISRVVPDGIGTWDHAWEIVAAADTAFMLALLEWEATGQAALKRPLRDAYFAVIDAWREAAGAYLSRTSMWAND